MNIYIDTTALLALAEQIARGQPAKRTEKKRTYKVRTQTPKKSRSSAITTRKRYQDSDDSAKFENAARMIFKLSQKWVPVKTGRLKKSAALEFIGGTWQISYQTPYAVFVHELMGNKHAPPTQAKYLEEAAYYVNSYLNAEGYRILFKMEMDRTEVRLILRKLQQKR